MAKENRLDGANNRSEKETWLKTALLLLAAAAILFCALYGLEMVKATFFRR